MSVFLSASAGFIAGMISSMLFSWIDGDIIQELQKTRVMLAERDAALLNLANRGKTVYEHYETQELFAGFEIREALGKFSTESGA